MRCIAWALTVMLGIAVPQLARAEISTADIERARARVLTPKVQPTLPGLEGEEGMGSGSGSADGKPRLRPTRDRARRIDTREMQQERGDEPMVSGLVNMLMWVFIIVGAALLIFWIVTELMKSQEDPTVGDAKQGEDAHDAETRAIIDKPLGDADELAVQGKYAEAIHTLLLRTLQELARSAMVRVERSHTSREILARVPLLADAREALAGLITAVELTHFGDDPATEHDYARCREQFHRFAAAFRASRAQAQSQAVAA